MYNLNTFIIMKSFMNISKLAITTLVTASVFVACSKDDDPAEYTTQYTANTGNLKGAGNAVDLGLPSGTKWADRNVGASSESDNGILFIWGDVTGTKMASETSGYAATNPLSAQQLFDMYKAEQKVGYFYDTTSVYKVANALSEYNAELAGDSGLDSTKVEKFIESNIEHFIAKYANKGKLQGTLTIGDFVLVRTLATKYAEGQVVALDNRKGTFSKDKFAGIKNSDKVNISIDFIDSTEVKYYVASQGNKTSKAKGVDGIERETFNGADMTIPVDYLCGNANFDAATANWGSNWVMPTKEQMQELIDNCTWEFTGNGYKVTTKSKDPKVKGNSIFLPAAGFRSGSTWIGNGNAGYYASGAIYGAYHFPSMKEQSEESKGAVNSKDATPSMLIFQHGQFDNNIRIYNNLTSNYGLSVRPVAK